MIFEQGDLIELNFDPTVGHEPQKRRPALVVSDGFFNNILSSLTVVCPITSTVNGHPLHIEIAEENPIHGCICLEALRAVDLNDSRSAARHLGAALDQATMTRVLDGIGAIFGI
ncbi:MAG: type II toxin-antitoxin system PemK/MazF family toxin [Coriobacteriales bacterium]|nr:type II toxin-antitoxin system PemK/MazF family toxin [Coriobacteriales bacterium]